MTDPCVKITSRNFNANLPQKNADGSPRRRHHATTAPFYGLPHPQGCRFSISGSISRQPTEATRHCVAKQDSAGRCGATPQHVTPLVFHKTTGNYQVSCCTTRLALRHE